MDRSDEILRRITFVEAEGDPQRAERLLLDVIEPLLEADGYDVRPTGGGADRGIDFLAQAKHAAAPHQRIGIQYKHLNRPTGVSAVQQVISAAILQNLDKMILLSRSGFSRSARTVLDRHLPTTVELVDIPLLRAWATRLGAAQSDPERSAAVQAITELSATLARIVAVNPFELDHVEWRDLERLISVVFAGLGFQVTLTPAAKDGGRDLILQFSVERANRSFIVEAKHWRSRQKVGKGHLTNFVKVMAAESRDGGLFLATYGYAGNAFEAVTEVERPLHTGDGSKIVALCRTFVRAEAGLLVAPSDLTELVTSDTKAWLKS
jgi:restriction system protein